MGCRRAEVGIAGSLAGVEWDQEETGFGENREQLSVSDFALGEGQEFGISRIGFSLSANKP